MWGDFILILESGLFSLMMYWSFNWGEFRYIKEKDLTPKKTPKKDIFLTTIHFNKKDEFKTEFDDNFLVGVENNITIIGKDTKSIEKNVIEDKRKENALYRLNPLNVINDISDIFPKKENKPQWLQNAQKVFNPQDVLTDAHVSFSRRYEGHVQLESDAQDHVLTDIDKKKNLQQDFANFEKSHINNLVTNFSTTFGIKKKNQDKFGEFNTIDTNFPEETPKEV